MTPGPASRDGLLDELGLAAVAMRPEDEPAGQAVGDLGAGLN